MMPYQEGACTLKDRQGRTYTAGGAKVTPEGLVAYIGQPLGDGLGCDRVGSTSRRALTDWHGRTIGVCYVSATWATPRDHVGPVMHQVTAWVDGREYTGRSRGEGMVLIARARRVREHVRSSEQHWREQMGG